MDYTTPSAKKKKAQTKPVNVESLPLEEQLAYAKEQIAQEKAGKRKLFHSLVKLAEDLNQTRQVTGPLQERQKYQERTWYAGGIWRAPDLLPAVTNPTPHVLRLRESISLTDLFFSLVIVTGFTRVGVAMSEQGGISFGSFCYFAIFFNVWSKHASYSTRFDTTDLSAQITILITCLTVLFASLSVQAPINSADANRIMYMAAAVALLNNLLYWRVLWATRTSGEEEDATTKQLAKHVARHAVVNIALTTVEFGIWVYGSWRMPIDWEYRWVIFVLALMTAAVRIPRAFLGNDFHAACSKRGVLFILLLGFLLQSVVVVSSEFFAYQTPTLENYSFMGAVCVTFFCIKLLYVDDTSDTLAQDHALLVNRWAAFFFHFGQFALLLSTTLLGSGLNLLTHSYLAATAALPGPEKHLVCAGFAAVLLSSFFIRSMHIKRIPTDRRNRALFIGAYFVETVVLLAVAIVAVLMANGGGGNFLEYLLASDIQLVFALAGAATFVVVMSWLDEGVELTLYESVEDSRSYRVHPFGFWWCCLPYNEQDQEALERDMMSPLVSVREEDAIVNEEFQSQRRRRRSGSGSASNLQAVLSPFMAHSVAREMRAGYDSVSSLEKKQDPSSSSDV